MAKRPEEGNYSIYSELLFLFQLHQHIAENPEGVFDVNNLSLNLPTFRQVAVLIKEEGIDEEYVEVYTYSCI